MKPHGFLILGVIAIALQLGCAKGGNKSAEKPAEAPADKSGQSETLGNGITIQKNADGSLNPESMKTEFRKKYPELNTKCAAMARSFLGSFKTWDFAVDHWTIGKSTTPIANKDMRAKGYDIVYRVYPSDVEVTSDESKSQLIAKMNTGAEVKSVVWDIFPNAAG